MTSIPLTCDGFADALADYMERDDSPRVRAAVEAHAASCAACGAVLADLQQLRVDAAGLPTLSPSRDLWAGIAERIATPVIEIGRGQAGPRSEVPSPRSKVRGSRWVRPVAAAAALVAMTAGVTYVVTRQVVLSGTELVSDDSATRNPQQIVRDANESARREATVERQVAAMPGDEPAPRAVDGGSAAARSARTLDRGPGTPDVRASLASNQTTPPVAAVEDVYGREIARLRLIVEQRRATLDTATIGVLERNLDIIDKAIRESRAALARDPASALLNEQLNNALEQKVDLLRAAALLPARS